MSEPVKVENHYHYYSGTPQNASEMPALENGQGGQPHSIEAKVELCLKMLNGYAEVLGSIAKSCEVLARSVAGGGQNEQEPPKAELNTPFTPIVKANGPKKMSDELKAKFDVARKHLLKKMVETPSMAITPTVLKQWLIDNGYKALVDEYKAPWIPMVAGPVAQKYFANTGVADNGEKEWTITEAGIRYVQNGCRRGRLPNSQKTSAELNEAADKIIEESEQGFNQPAPRLKGKARERANNPFAQGLTFKLG